MNSEWRKQLERTGAVIQDGRIISFGDTGAGAAAADRDLMADLSHYGLLQVTGQDAAEFLQGQLTNDIRQVSLSRSQLSAYCNPKGRMLAVVRVIRRGDAFLLQMPVSRLAAVQSRLRMYVMRADVQLQDVSEDLVRIGLSGEGAAELLRQNVESVPVSVSDSCDGPVTVIRLPGAKPRFELIAEPGRALEMWRRLGDLPAAGPDVWGLLDALAGLPEVHEATVEAFVPQMANLDLVGGVSFTKGCYTGQEVVARLHYKGESKRRIFAARVDQVSAPEVGSPVTNSDGQAVGSVINRGLDATHHPIVLLELAIKSSEQDLLLASKEENSLLTLLPLPYSAAAKT